MKGTQKQERVIWKKGGRGGKKGELPLPSFLPLYFCVHAFLTLQTQLSQSLEQDSMKPFLESEGSGLVGVGGRRGASCGMVIFRH